MTEVVSGHFSSPDETQPTVIPEKDRRTLSDKQEHH